MLNWSSVLIDRADKLEHAVNLLNNTALRILLVVDHARRLAGTVTDGDIRRAVLRGIPMDAPVSDVMCDAPTTAKAHWSRDRSLALMTEKSVFHLPVVDDEGVVIGLESIHDLIGKRSHDNIVFLMAGGFGKRLHPLTDTIPKPLLRVGDKPILEIILQGFINAGFYRFFISTFYRADMIRDYFGDGSNWGISIEYVQEDQSLGTAGALSLLPHEQVIKPVFVMNGDLLTNLNYGALLDFHAEHGGSATVCVREHEYQVPYGVLTTEGSRISTIVEKPVYRYFINAGIYLLSPEIVRKIKPSHNIDMPTVLENAIQDGHALHTFPIHEYWLDVGRHEDFARAQIDVHEL